MNVTQSASGYAGLDATPLGQIGYQDEIVMNAWERDFLDQITNSAIDERIVKCYDTVQFQRQPRVGPWRTYEKNQELIPTQITPEGFCFQLQCAKYQDIKFDQMDVTRACERWGRFEAAFLDSTYQSLSEEWRSFVFNGMMLETDILNKGSNAGINGGINLGAPGAPVAITPENILANLARIRQVLRDRQRWVEGEMFVVLPTAFMEILVQSKFADAAWSGDCVQCSMGITGFWPQKLLGFNVVESTYAPRFIDSTGVVAYAIIAGHSQAYAFAADIVEGRLVRPTNTFSIEYQMLATWGGKAIYPDALAVAYWTLTI